MGEIKVEIQELKSEGDETIKELADFIKEKTNTDVNVLTDEILVQGGDKNVSRTYLRVILRKFLHRAGLRDYYKVIGSKGGSLVVKEKKTVEEEE